MYKKNIMKCDDSFYRVIALNGAMGKMEFQKPVRE